MSSVEKSTSDSGSNEYSSEISEEEFIELEDQETLTSEDDDNDEQQPYSDEPLADAEWLEQYHKRQQEKNELEEQLRTRLTGTVQTGEWCKCGNCNIDLLQNISECYCCSELDGCVEALTSDLVQQDLVTGQVLSCITEHPGFQPVCLEKWSLRLSATKYNTRDKKKYRQIGSEESFLRSISYREFTRLVYGFLGKNRIPLPACAYTAIRKIFPTQEEEEFTGFEMEED